MLKGDLDDAIAPNDGPPRVVLAQVAKAGPLHKILQVLRREALDLQLGVKGLG